MRSADSISPLRQMVADLALLQAEDKQAILAGLDSTERNSVEALLETLQGTPLPARANDPSLTNADPATEDVVILSAVLDQLSDDLAVAVLGSCPPKIRRTLSYMLSDERRVRLTAQPQRRLTLAVKDMLRQAVHQVQLDSAHIQVAQNPSLMSQLFARVLHRSEVF
jgi:hypothetical protein